MCSTTCNFRLPCVVPGSFGGLPSRLALLGGRGRRLPPPRCAHLRIGPSRTRSMRGAVWDVGGRAATREGFRLEVLLIISLHKPTRSSGSCRFAAKVLGFSRLCRIWGATSLLLLLLCCTLSRRAWTGRLEFPPFVSNVRQPPFWNLPVLLCRCGLALHQPDMTPFAGLQVSCYGSVRRGARQALGYDSGVMGV